jgi:hypothetical protein
LEFGDVFLLGKAKNVLWDGAVGTAGRVFLSLEKTDFLSVAAVGITGRLFPSEGKNGILLSGAVGTAGRDFAMEMEIVNELTGTVETAGRDFWTTAIGVEYFGAVGTAGRWCPLSGQMSSTTSRFPLDLAENDGFVVHGVETPLETKSRRLHDAMDPRLSEARTHGPRPS